ncbi:response regulator transcription factor [Solihabitans fulvus]|nr:response regulator transcription factor [Solihabitans fulvus]
MNPRPLWTAGATRSASGEPGIALVDPIPLFREGLSSLILRTPGMRWLGSTGHLHTAVKLHDRLHPNVMMIDSVLDPRAHLAQVLRSSDPTLVVLALVRELHRNVGYLAAARAVGVQGFVLRTSEPAQIVEAIRRTYQERQYIDPTLAPLAKGLVPGHQPTPQQPLSRREYEVLQLIADGLENQAVAKKLFVSVETVRTHVKSILRKLRARDRTHAVALAFRAGLLASHREAQVPTQSSTLDRPAVNEG